MSKRVKVVKQGQMLPDGTATTVATEKTEVGDAVSFEDDLEKAAAAAKVQTGPAAACSRCGKNPVPTASRGIAGSARKAGICLPCWKAQNVGVRSGPTGPRPKEKVADLGSSLKGLDELLAELDQLAKEIDASTPELLERARRWVHEIRSRTGGIRMTFGRIEKGTREASAEIRRQTKYALQIRDDIRGATARLPKVPHGEDIGA